MTAHIWRGRNLLMARDMRPVNGIIRPQHEVHCAACERPLMGLGWTVAEAATELRAAGWRELGRLWHCPDCAGRVERAAAGAP